MPTSDRLQRLLHPWSAFVVVPLFGLANAGIPLDAESLQAAAQSRLAIGVAVALVLGNAIGITGAATLAIRLGLGELPGRVRWGHLLGGAVLAGIGFTISLFIAELAFDDPAAAGEREDRHPRRVAHRRGARLGPAAVARREAAAVLPAQRRAPTRCRRCRGGHPPADGLTAPAG